MEMISSTTLNPLTLLNYVYIFVSALNLLKIVCVIYFYCLFDFFFFPCWILIYEKLLQNWPCVRIWDVRKKESFRCPPSPVCIYCVIGMRGTHSSQFNFYFLSIYFGNPKNYFFVDVE